MFVIEEVNRAGLAYRCPVEGWICTISLKRAQTFRYAEEAEAVRRLHYTNKAVRVVHTNGIKQKGYVP